MTNSERIFTYRGQSDIQVVVPIAGYQHDFSQVLDHPKTRRLKRIGQLKPIDHIYTGATHSRYEHVLGVFGMAQDVVLRENGDSSNAQIKMTPYEKFLTILIGLAHDHGHGPYSHVYEIVAQAYGGPDHKENFHRFVAPQMAPEIQSAGGRPFARNRIVDDLIQEVEESGPLYKFVTNRDRLDKLDYTVRDFHYCQKGSVPDIPTLIGGLDFDGDTKRSALHYPTKDALRAFLEALTNNNTSIYINKDVEICEGLLIRAIAGAVDKGFDVMKGYRMTDEELNTHLREYGDSSDLLERIYASNFTRNSPYVQVAAIKPTGYGWLEERDTAVIEEASEREIDRLAASLNLRDVMRLEKQLKTDMRLQNDELFITFSPQIDRLKFPHNGANIYYMEGGRKVYKSIFEATPGLYDYLSSRIKEHYAIRLIATREKAGRVADFLKGTSFSHMLGQMQKIAGPEQTTGI